MQMSIRGGLKPVLLTMVKKKVRLLMRGVAGTLHALGFTPNSVSVVGLLLSVASAFLYGFAQREELFVPIAAAALFLSGFLDVIDGLMAELFYESSSFGGVLDSLSDRYADALVICGIILGGLCDLSWGLAALVGSILVSYVRARAEAADVKMESVGLMERAERILVIVAASLLFLVNHASISYSIVLIAILTHLTVLQRMLYLLKTTSTGA